MMDPATLAAYGGLFTASFLAATILPLGSESVVVAMAVAGYSPAWILALATVGNTLGAIANYGAGRLGELALIRRYRVEDLPHVSRAQHLVRRWGPPVMILAWVPGIGDPLTVIAGIAGMPFGRFCFWVCLGKGLRYAVLLFAADRVQMMMG